MGSELAEIKIKPFDGKNFDSWKYRVENFLEAHGVKKKQFKMVYQN